jgi:hypothetical protein
MNTFKIKSEMCKWPIIQYFQQSYFYLVLLSPIWSQSWKLFTLIAIIHKEYDAYYMIYYKLIFHQPEILSNIYLICRKR